MNYQKELEYKRYYILQPNYYQKLVDVYDKHRQSSFSELDKDVYNILYDKKLSDNQKYYSYLQKINKRMKEIKQLAPVYEVPEESINESIIEPIIQTAPAARVKEETFVKPKVLASIETQTSPKKYRQKGVQTDTAVKTVDTGTGATPFKEDLYESIPVQTEPVPAPTVKENNVSTDHFLESKLHELAQSYLKEPSASNIVLDKKTLKDQFRVFHNERTNDSIAVEVRPVFESMYGEKGDINWNVLTETKDGLNSQYILLTESDQPLAVKNIRQKRKKKSSVSDSVLEKTLQEIALENASLDSTLLDLVVEKDFVDKDFRIFKDTRTGDRIAIEIAPVIDNLLNKTAELTLDLEITPNKKDKGTNYIVLRNRAIKKPDKTPRKKRKSSKQRSASKQSGKGYSIQWSLI